MIQAEYQIPIASPGAILRAERRAGTALGVEADKMTSGGRLIPDEMVNEVMRGWLERYVDGFILDGYPRSIGQADALDSVLAKAETRIEAVLFLKADTATIESRVERRMMCSRCGHIVGIGFDVPAETQDCPACGGALVKRTDDTPDTLAARMHEYAEKTEPLVASYGERGLLFPLEADQTPDLVFKAIAEILEEP